MERPVDRASPRHSGASNSFDYVPLRTLPGFVPDPVGCPMSRLGLDVLATSRALVAIVEGRAVFCATRTRDFEDVEIRHVVHACGQLYLDVSGKLQIDDFATDVRQLVIAEPCRACPRLPSCSGTYTVAPRDFFAEDEAWLRERLGGLVGAVLDVGAGRQPYLAALEPLIRAGRVELHVLDPELTASPHPPVAVHLTTVEVADLPDAGFDACLAIRSLNHFSDVGRALANMARWLRPGGRLLLVESLPLPLLRTRRAAARAHARATGGFQHSRNWSSGEVLSAACGDIPFEVAFHRPVGRDTTDQWILELVRR